MTSKAVKKLAATSKRTHFGAQQINLTVFVEKSGQILIYSSRVGKNGKKVVANEPRTDCADKLEATLAFGRILDQIQA
jgi:hypothetical protein